MKQYFMYLRKSRKDRDLELQAGGFDTLQRHRDALLSLAKQRGYSIARIYEEVVSGDSIAGTPPYGCRKVKLPHQKGYTLEPAPETADVVREIFQLYTLGDPQPDGGRKPLGSCAIANLLNTRGVLSPGGVQWSAAVRDAWKNPVRGGQAASSFHVIRYRTVSPVPAKSGRRAA